MGASDEAFQPTSVWKTATRSHVLWVGTFDNVEEKTQCGVRDQFSDKAKTIFFQNWKIWFEMWMREKHQCNTSFSFRNAFEPLSLYLEHKSLHTYEQWRDAHWMELRQVERYWEIRVELVYVLKGGATFSWLAKPVVKTEQEEYVFVVDMEATFLNKPKKNVSTFISASTSSLIFSVFGYAQATEAALASLGVLPVDPMQVFQLHLEEEYGGFYQDQIQRIQVFRREKENTPCIIYMRLARFAREPGGVFTVGQLVKVFFVKDWQTPLWPNDAQDHHGLCWAGDIC